MEWTTQELIGSDYEKNQVLECRTLFDDDDLMTKLRNSNFDLAVEDMGHLCPVVQ